MNKFVSRRDWLQTSACALAGLVGPATAAWAAGPSGAAATAQKPVAAKPVPSQNPTHWPAWEGFKKQFVSASGRVISNDPEGSRTYSEGQSYALFFALVANDRAMFDAVLKWTEDNLCGGDMTARLPAWLWGQRKDGDWGVIDSNSASDSDLWIAYALGEAGRLWGDRRYRALSSLLAARVMREETADIPGLGLTLLPAPKGFEEGAGRWRLNPSYLPMHLMHWLAATETDPRWAQLAESSLQLIVRSAPKGFSPDWTLYDVREGFLVYPEGNKGQGTYNAIRVYTWAGMMHADAPGVRQLLSTLAPMARFVRDKGYPPESIDIVSGQPSGPGSSGFSAAMLPFLHAVGDTATLRAQVLRLQARPLRPDAYYEHVLGLFGQGWLDGWFRFTPTGHVQPRWKPA